MNADTNHQKCIVCKSTNIVPGWLVTSNADGPLTEPYTLEFCQDCSVGLTFPIPDNATLDTYYSQGVYEKSGGRISRLFDMILSLLSEIRLKEISRVSQLDQGELLDIGCGKGRFLANAAKHNWKVSGTDISQSQAEATSRRYDIDVFCGELRDAGFMANDFDVVVSWHVLEHLYDPHETIVEIERVLKTGGLFVCEVPNIASWQAIVGQNNWFQLDVPRHLTHFTPEAICYMLEEHGFEIVNVKTFAVQLGFYGMLQSCLNRTGLPANSLFQWLKKSKSYSTPITIANLLLASLFFIPASLLELISATIGRGGVIRVMAIKK